MVLLLFLGLLSHDMMYYEVKLFFKFLGSKFTIIGACRGFGLLNLLIFHLLEIFFLLFLLIPSTFSIIIKYFIYSFAHLQFSIST